jgi:hypothetical protein
VVQRERCADRCCRSEREAFHLWLLSLLSGA